MSDFTIAGGGIIGMLVARELVQAGASVTLLERGGVARESSWAGGGILSPLYPWRYPDAVNRLAAWSQQAYPHLCAELTEATGINPEWTPSGLLVADMEREAAAARHWARARGISLETVDTREVQEIEPACVSGMGGGVWMPEVAQVRNPRLVHALRQWLADSGVEIREQSEVTHIKVSDGQVMGVDTVSGHLPTAHLILAAGAWTGKILAQLAYALPVKPVQGQMLLYKAAPQLIKRIVLSGDRYVIPRRDGRVLVGSTLEEVGFEKHTTVEARAELEREARRIIPALAAFPIERHWAGLRPAAPDGIPFLGQHPHIGGLFVAAGHFRNGVVLGPASACLLADQILARTPILDSQAYQLPASPPGAANPD